MDLVRLNIAKAQAPTVKKAEANLTSTAKAATPAKQQQSVAPKPDTKQDSLAAWAKKIKSQGHDKIPAIRSSLKGRQAIQAGLL